MKYAVLIIFCFTISGCSIPRAVTEGGPISGYQVSSTNKVLILKIVDGQEQGQPAAKGSGQGMVSALRRVLVAHGIPISESETTSVSKGFEEAQRTDCGYVLKGVITLWEDNATAWSGNGDKLTLSLELYNIKSHELIAAATHRRIATGATFLSGSPTRFMNEAAVDALSKIYGWPQQKP